MPQIVVRVAPIRGGHLLGSLLLAALLLASGHARALSLADTKPIYLLGGGQFGFSKSAIDAAGLPVAAYAKPGDDFLSAGNVSFNPALSITQVLSPAYQNPQAAYQNPAAGCHAGDTCQTVANPFIADSTWTVTNRSGRDLDNVYLLFTMVSLSGGYPNIPVALDAKRISILEYLAGGTKYWFGFVSLGGLGDGNANDGTPGELAQSTQFTMRYIVGGDMPFSGNQQVMPPIGVFALNRETPLVPEPGTALLLASGLAVIGMAKRSRA
jgi:hypothetical protein